MVNNKNSLLQVCVVLGVNYDVWKLKFGDCPEFTIICAEF